MDEQIARCMVIHQMLSTWISDTLTLAAGLCNMNETSRTGADQRTEADEDDRDCREDSFIRTQKFRREMDLALERQTGVIDKRRGILDSATDKQIETLQYQIAQLQAEKEELKKKNFEIAEKH